MGLGKTWRSLDSVATYAFEGSQKRYTYATRIIHPLPKMKQNMIEMSKKRYFSFFAESFMPIRFS